MRDTLGPVGFKFIDSAPRDGSFLRLRFGANFGDREEIGQWQSHDEMKAGGHWFDEQGYYITPGPVYWCARLAASAKDAE